MKPLITATAFMLAPGTAFAQTPGEQFILMWDLDGDGQATQADFGPRGRMINR